MKTSLLLLVTLLASCTCQEASDPPVPAAAPLPQHADIIVLVTVDTLRSDFVSFGGYAQPTTPYVDALTEKGTWFSHAFSPSSWTAPSMASLFTGVYPTTHGVQTGGKDLETGEVVVPILSEPLETLAESLQAAGYRTIGTPSNRLLAKDRGFAQGFDTYPDKAPFIEANKVNAIVRRQLKAAYGDTWKTSWKNDKVFLWIHYYDPHLPWPPHPKLAPKFAPDFNGSLDTFPIDQNAKQLAKRFPDPDAEDVRRFRAMYAQDVRYFDEQFKILSTELGLDDPNVALFITSDHGEEIFEHGDLSHGNTLFDDQVHVPMLLRVPGGPAGQVIERPVSTVDLMPTLLGQLGIPAPEDAQGVDRLAPDAPAVDATFIEYPTYDSSAQKAWVEGPFKYLWDPLYQTEALYDFVADPAESVDVKDQHPEVVARAREALREFRLAHLSAGRFHLRVRGTKGQRLQLRVSTDDLFDANFITRPALAPDAFEMDLDRSYLALDTVLENDRLELRCWCRGSDLRVEATLDGEPLNGLTLAPGSEARPLPADFDRGELPERRAEDLGWPGRGQAWMWLEAGASEALPVVNTPEEADRLKELGYR